MLRYIQWANAQRAMATLPLWRGGTTSPNTKGEENEKIPKGMLEGEKKKRKKKSSSTDESGFLKPTYPYRVERILSNLGYCQRKDVKRFLKQNNVTGLFKLPNATTEERAVTSSCKVEPLKIRINGQPIPGLKPITIVLHKPTGFVCSKSTDGDTTAQTVFDLLPTDITRRKPELTIAGRLDKYASGTLILSQDGRLINRIISPSKRRLIPKTYTVQMKWPITQQAVEAFASGQIQLRSEKQTCRPALLEVLDQQNRLARITLTEGRYHQIRRMTAAVGNMALTVHRERVGPVNVDDLEPGQWRQLKQEEIDALVKSNLKAKKMAEKEQKAMEEKLTKGESLSAEEKTKKELADAKKFKPRGARAITEQEMLAFEGMTLEDAAKLPTPEQVIEEHNKKLAIKKKIEEERRATELKKAKAKGEVEEEGEEEDEDEFPNLSQDFDYDDVSDSDDEEKDHGNEEDDFDLKKYKKKKSEGEEGEDEDEEGEEQEDEDDEEDEDEDGEDDEGYEEDEGEEEQDEGLSPEQEAELKNMLRNFESSLKDNDSSDSPKK